MPETPICSRCGAPLQRTSLPGNVCPTCLLKLGLAEDAAQNDTTIAGDDAAVLGHYRLLERLAAGGMGVVYRAWDEHLDRDVAVKLLPKATLSEAHRKRFRKEARVLSKINHPHICTIHDFDTQDGVDFLVMEYLKGPTLAQKLAHGPFPERELVAVSVQIVEALEAAHERGIVHRDLKPSNIVLIAGRHVKVLDFGLARSLRPVTGTSFTSNSLEPAGEVAGTLLYMAPEQLRGETVDPRSDIYAAGAVFYELATGARIFVEQSEHALIDAIMRREPVSPHERGARVSRELERIILKCLDKEADNRYQSAKELAVDLRRLSSTPTSRPVQRRAQRRVSWRVVAVVTGLAVAALTAWRIWVANHPLEQIESLVVLPLKSLSGDPEQDYFADGMTEAIITNLGKIRALRVVSRTTTMCYKGTRKTVPEIARELNVDAVVEGSVLRSDGRVRITAQLVRAVPEKNLWAETYERDAGVALQNEVARDIAQAISVQLTPEEASRLASDRPVSREAHEAYLRGRWHWNKRTADGFRKAVEYFREAIAQDSTYALAHAGLADAYALFGSIGYDVMLPRQATALARPAALRALALDPSLAEAHCALAHIEHDYDWNLERAEQGFRRALELNPGYATAHQWYGFLLATRGKLEAAAVEARRAQELDPLSSVIDASLGRILYYARQYDAAATELHKALDIDPTYAGAHLVLGMIYRQQGRTVEALASFQRGREIAPGSAAHLVGMGSIYALSGRSGETRQIVEELLAMSRQRYVPAYYIAALYLDLGDHDRGLEWLAKACDERSEPMLYLQLDPVLDRVRTDARFQELVRRVGLPIS